MYNAHQTTENLKSCPFCKGKDIRFSIKSRGRIKYAAHYCNKCHAYGARTMYKLQNGDYLNDDVYSELQQKSIIKWNDRKQ